MSGCKIVRAVGETVVDTGRLIGIGGSDNENNDEQSEPKGNGVSVYEHEEEEGTSLLVGAFVIALVLFLITLGIRYYYFRE